MSLCKVQLIGYIGADAKINSNLSVAQFSLAVNTGNTEKKETTWFTVNVWKENSQKLEKTCELLKKGRQIYVEGKLEVKKHTNKEGQTKTYLNVKVADFELLNHNVQNKQN